MKQNGLERKGLQKSAKVAMEAISNIRTVASLNREQTFHDRYMNSLTAPHIATKRNSFLKGMVFGFTLSAPLFTQAIVIYYGGWLVLNAGLNYNVVFQVSQAFIMGMITLSQVVIYMPNYSQAKLAASR